MAKAQLALQWIALVAIGSLTLADVASIVANDDNVNVNVNMNASAIVSCDIPNESVRGRCLPPSQCVSFLKVLNETSSVAAPQPESLRFLEKVKCESESGSMAEVCCPVNGRDYAHPAVEVMRDVGQRTLSFSRSRNKTKKLKRRIQTVPSTGEYNLFNECGKQVTNRIYGGEIAELDEYPWLALLVYNSNDYGCSGALIDDRHVLTAAHCVQGVRVREKNGLKSVRLGEFNVKTEPDCIKEQNYLNCNNPALDMNVGRIFVHPEYDEFSVNKFNDISVIRLKTAVPFTHFVMPICLPGVADREEKPFKPGHMFSVSGWGQTDLFNKYYPDIQSPIKLKLRVPLVGSDVCSKILKAFGVQVGPKQICAGGEMAKDTCAGDSGGPLMYFSRKHSRWVAYGIVSYGFTQCGMAGHPAVYTNVSAYIDWIGEVTKS